MKKDRIWINGNIITEDAACPRSSALYCSNGIIRAIGSDEEILQLKRDADAEIINLEGRCVLPGFIDSHMHLIEYSQQNSLIHLHRAASLEEVIELCKAGVDRAAANGKWVCAIGFNQDDWTVKKLPTRRDLDLISTEVPVTIRRVCMHISVCNTAALKAMGLFDNPPSDNPENFGSYEDGSLNGIIREQSQSVIFDALPSPGADEIREFIIDGCRQLAAQGIVEVQTDDFHAIANEHGETIIEVYKELAEHDSLPIRIYEQCYLPTEDCLNDFLSEGHYTGEEYGLFRIGPLKIVMDGSLGSHSAFMRKPYLNDPSTRGIAYYDSESLYRLCRKAHDAGMQIATHCIGDAALEETLAAYRRVINENPRKDCRHGVVHCQIMDDEQLDMFRELDLIGYIQPVFLRYDMNIVDDCVGPELGRSSYNWRRFLDQGVHISGGSDCPVEPFDIMPNLQYAVSRRNYAEDKTWHPENSMTMDEALRAFTCEGAYASFAEKTRGTLSVGKDADMVIIDRDITNTPHEDIDRIEILETIVRGRTVYRKT